MLSYQYDIFKSLNLAPTTEFDRPGDFYVTIVSAIESYFRDILIGGCHEGNVSYTSRELASMRRLTDAKMTRSLVKKAIMTTPYGVKNHYMASYIIGDLIYSHKTEGNPELGNLILLLDIKCQTQEMWYNRTTFIIHYVKV